MRTLFIYFSKCFLILGVVSLSIFQTVFATPTKIIVRAKAKDAKFIGTSIGGAMVIIRDANTQEILAKGLTQGSTGNTQLIMREAHTRYMRISDANTAKFEATLDLEEPTFVTIEVQAPYNKKQARVQASTQIWLIPGKDILGDGIILEIPGFIVDVLAPQSHQFISLENGNAKIKVQANVVMMCGCTTSKGGLWDAEQFEIKALVKRDGQAYATVDLVITEQVNTYVADFITSESGAYEFVVYVYDPKTGNTGLDKVNVVVGD